MHRFVLAVPRVHADAVSDWIWAQAGVLGIEENPVGVQNGFEIPAEFDVLEFGSEAARSCAEYLTRDGFRDRHQHLWFFVYVAEDHKDQFQEATQKSQELRGWACSVEEHGPLENIDYLKNYRDSVQPVVVDEQIWIGPPWKAPEPTSHFKHVLYVDPGMAFGTGEHPTTQLCLKFLLDLHKERKLSPERVWDLGCGTGVLGLFAKRLWPKAVLTLSDTDPQCAEEVTKTFSNNKESLLGVHLHVGDSAELVFNESVPWNLVVSNIYVEVLLALAPRILDRLAPGGTWVLSGILNGPHDEQLKQILERSFLSVVREEITRQRPQLNLDSGFQSKPETWVAYRCEGKK